MADFDPPPRARADVHPDTASVPGDPPSQDVPPLDDAPVPPLTTPEETEGG